MKNKFSLNMLVIVLAGIVIIGANICGSFMTASGLMVTGLLPAKSLVAQEYLSYGLSLMIHFGLMISFIALSRHRRYRFRIILLFLCIMFIATYFSLLSVTHEAQTGVSLHDLKVSSASVNTASRVISKTNRSLLSLLSGSWQKEEGIFVMFGAVSIVPYFINLLMMLIIMVFLSYPSELMEQEIKKFEEENENLHKKRGLLMQKKVLTDSIDGVENIHKKYQSHTNISEFKEKTNGKNQNRKNVG